MICMLHDYMIFFNHSFQIINKIIVQTKLISW